VSAYKLGNFMRSLAMPKAAEAWSLTGRREKLIKIGAKSHCRYITFHMAEIAMSRQMFREILSVIARLRAPPAPALRGPGNKYDGQRRLRCALMKANQRLPTPRGRLLIALLTAPATGSGGISVESAFTRFFAYVVARIVRRHQQRSYPRNVDLPSGVDRPSIWEMSVHLRL
jgi:hypothetical protein